MNDAYLLRMQTPHAPDMLELSHVYERKLRMPEAPRHFPDWEPSLNGKSALMDDHDDAASDVHSRVTMST